MRERQSSSHLFAGNAPFVEGLYEDYLRNPSSVSSFWKAYFDKLQHVEGSAERDPSHADYRHLFEELGRMRSAAPPVTSTGPVPALAVKQAGVLRLIKSYRLLGHLIAELDSIKLRKPFTIPDLTLEYQGLDEEDLETTFTVGTLHAPAKSTLREILQIVRETYSGHIGTEYMHINDIRQKEWIQERLERSRTKLKLTPERRRHLLSRLTAAEGMERYLHTKYAGQKRFSLEGGDGLIPLLDALIQKVGQHGLRELVMGMAHRGRLNVLINIMGKTPRELFAEFEGKLNQEIDVIETGDVKYHAGFSSDIVLPSGPLHMSLAFNPSHLEIIDPVVEGSVRARQDRRDDWKREEVMPVLIHGDASIAGQGVVYETFNLAQTRGYSTGGTIHIVVNNRIGFTLSNPLDAHSLLYCTDIGKVIQAPILHVNGDDPEAIAFAVDFAVDFRMEFKKDVVIDLICYRKHGHNEADEPAATQPKMYEKIRKHPGARAMYADRLVASGQITAEEVEKMVLDYRDALDAGHQVSGFESGEEDWPAREDWHAFRGHSWDEPTKTALPAPMLKRLGTRINTILTDVGLHPRVARVVNDRLKMVAGGLPMDWGCAETLAYATLLHEGFSVRISGQDSGRGTFFHRHAVLHNQRTGESYIPLAHVAPKPVRFNIIDSILSEEAVLGFEFGYSTTDPQTLVVWEAQFGDFANVAQVVIDQFISSSEVKWGRLSGMVLMLPHGWEGQGPEHSSARLERFMQLCAHENMQVCNPTTPAQMFHVLRRQMIRKYRKPLIIMSPKSLLRRKITFSSLDDLSRGRFQVVIGEVDELKKQEVERIVLCSGKVYYDLLEARRKTENRQVAIIRVEQLYPFPRERLIEELEQYTKATEIIWTQEEPMNQGAWYSIQHHLRECMRPGRALGYAGRLSSPSPSGGSYKLHLERQGRLVDAALNVGEEGNKPIIVLGQSRFDQPK